MKKFIPFLEIPVVEHCNLNCELCNSHAGLISESNYELEQFKKDVDCLVQFVHFGCITFMGGEPLMKSDLVEYIRYARSKKLGDVYRILTNGILLEQQPQELFALVDEIEVSKYPQMNKSKQDFEHFLAKQAKKFKFSYYVKDISYFNEVDTIELSQLQAQIGYVNCEKIKHGCLIFQGYFYRCMRPKTTNLMLKQKYGIELTNDLSKTDGLEISPSTLSNHLSRYLNSKCMLESCKYCLMGQESRNVWLKTLIRTGYSNRVFVKLYYTNSFVHNMYKWIKKSIVFDEAISTDQNRCNMTHKEHEIMQHTKVG